MTFKEMLQSFPMAQGEVKLSHCSVQCTMTKVLSNALKTSLKIFSTKFLRKEGGFAMDQMVCYYSMKRITHKWPMIALFNKIDTSALLGIIIWIKLQPSVHARKLSAVSTYHISKITCMGNNYLQASCSETCFNPFVFCLRKNEQEKEMLLVPFGKGQET